MNNWCGGFQFFSVHWSDHLLKLGLVVILLTWLDKCTQPVDDNILRIKFDTAYEAPRFDRKSHWPKQKGNAPASRLRGLIGCCNEINTRKYCGGNGLMTYANVMHLNSLPERVSIPVLLQSIEVTNYSVINILFDAWITHKNCRKSNTEPLKTWIEWACSCDSDCYLDIGFHRIHHMVSDSIIMQRGKSNKWINMRSIAMCPVICRCLSGSHHILANKIIISVLSGQVHSSNSTAARYFVEKLQLSLEPTSININRACGKRSNSTHKNYYGMGAQ